MDNISQQEYMDIFQIVGAAMQVHKVLGRGLDEAIYQEALGMEFKKRNIDAEPQKYINCYYGNDPMHKFYIADYEYKGIIIELKSVDRVIAEHRAQLFNYLRLTHTRRGILINFSEKSLRAERYLYQSESDDFILLSQNNYKMFISDEESSNPLGWH